MKNKDIQVTRQHDNSLLLATTFNGIRYNKKYYQYKLAECYTLFKEYVKQEDGKIFINQTV